MSDQSRNDLELEKLALEVLELRRPFWQRPVYLGVLIPIVLSLLAFLTALLSGYFDHERLNLRKEAELLRAENVQAQAELDRVEAKILAINKEVVVREQQILELSGAIKDLNARQDVLDLKCAETDKPNKKVVPQKR